MLFCKCSSTKDLRNICHTGFIENYHIKPASSNCAVNDITPKTEVEVETVHIGVVGTEDKPQGSLWEDSEIETVKPATPEPTRKKSNSGIKMTWEKLGRQLKTGWGGLYDSLNEEISNEKA